MEITLEQLRLGVLNISLFFIIGFAGAFTKDLYDTISGKNKKIQVSKVFIGAVFSAFVMLGISQPVTKRFDVSFNTIICINFITGVVGFELFGKLSTLRGLDKGFKKALEIKKALATASATTTKDSDGNTNQYQDNSYNNISNTNQYQDNNYNDMNNNTQCQNSDNTSEYQNSDNNYDGTDAPKDLF